MGNKILMKEWMNVKEEWMHGVCSGHLPMHNLVSQNNDHLSWIMLRHSVELEFRQGRMGKACVCSAMSLSEASAGDTWLAMWHWGEDSDHWWPLDFGPSIWVDGGATSWNGKTYRLGKQWELLLSWRKQISGRISFVCLILPILHIFHEHRLLFHA